MVLVPAGGFWMGCNGVRDSSCFDDEEPQHAVCLDAFEIDETEVTVAQYAACVDDGGCMNAGDTSEFCNSGESGRSDHPINCVDWDQAKAYCEWAGKRLPTEAEWEKAARYPDGRAYPWGLEYVSGYANVNEVAGKAGPHYLERTTAVGMYPQGANPAHGAHDLSGNVWEWGLSKWAANYAFPEYNDPEGNAVRVLRGGSWGYFQDYARAAYRYGYFPYRGDDNFGFRVVCGAAPS
jgi:formylglycine-generating enzyme required for sulfatase activity